MRHCLNKRFQILVAETDKQIIYFYIYFLYRSKLFSALLAKMVGVSRNTIRFIEKGQFNPIAKLALILCIALDKKFEELFVVLGGYDGKYDIVISGSDHIRYGRCKHQRKYQHNSRL